MSDGTGTTETKVDKRKGPKGPRPQYFIMAAVKKDELILDEIQNSDKTAAMAAFKDKHKVVATQVKGPVLFFKGGVNAAAASDKGFLNIPVRDVKFTGKSWEGIFKGWSVIAQGLKSVDKYGNDEVVMLIPEKALEKGNVKPKQKYILRSDIETSKAL